MIRFFLKPATHCRGKRSKLKATIESGHTATVAAEQLIEILQDLQQSHGYLPEGMLREIAGNLDVPLIEVYRVVNFYKAFSMEPKGRHQITICKGTACHVRRSGRLVEELRSLLGIGTGETTEDGQFTVETVNCLGACALGPVVVIDGEYHDHVTPAKLRSLIGPLAAESVDLEREAG